MEECITADAEVIDRQYLTSLYDEAEATLDDFRNDLHHHDYGFILKQIKSKAVPQCFGMVKDHQIHKRDADGNFPMRFVVPDNNFMSGFANVGYRLIKDIFERYDVPYTKHTIQTSAFLKDNLEEAPKLYGYTRGDCTIASMDCIKEYPSIKSETVRRAVNWFARNYRISCSPYPHSSRIVVNSIHRSLPAGHASTRARVVVFLTLARVELSA